MGKLTVVLFVAFVVGFGFLKSVKSEEVPESDHEREANEADENDRSGKAYAYASSSTNIRPAPGPRPYPPPGPPRNLVQCYACVDCPQVLQNTTTKWCPRTLNPATQSTCVTYAEKYEHLSKAWYIRGCASERGSCSDIKQAHSGHQDIVKLVSCYECEGDRCNGASRSITDLSIAIFAMLVAPLIAKVTLS